jgi:D-glycero-alpha-D-manno-heptose 1-phosphate guanylyltransferase
MQAIILAGGFGTRLQAIADGVPKPMVPVGGQPFLTWLLDYMRSQGVVETVLCLHHLHHCIQDHYGILFKGMRLRYAVERSPLGTGGAIMNALKQLKTRQPVFVLNGDSLVQLDYRRLRAEHITSGKKLTMATARMDDCGRYGQLSIKNNEITSFRATGEGAGDINTGFYMASPDLFTGHKLPKAFSFERDFLAPQVATLRPGAYSDVQYFIDIGIPKDYLIAQRKVPERLRATAMAA